MSGLKFNRRTVLADGGAGLISVALAAPVRKTFPRGFRWGASTAAHQIEGNNVNSDLWLMENVEPKTFVDRSGDACDSYHRLDADIALIKQIGLNSYRFSIEWARIEPSPGQFSNAELDYYKRLIAALRKAGIDPIVTFLHVSAPRWFAEAGGWLNPEAPQLFARYCDKAARVLGDGMAYACTINEPQVALTFQAMMTVMPQSRGMDPARMNAYAEMLRRAHAEAARRTGADKFITMNYPDMEHMTPQLIAGHTQGFAAIKAAQPKLPTGVTLSLIDFAPANEGSKHMELREAAYGEWMDTAKRAGDFVGVQVYEQARIPGPGPALPLPEQIPMAGPDEQRQTPIALRNIVEYTHQRTGLPIFVTENGLETDNDQRRAWYIPQVLADLHDAIANGVPVIGYCHWSLIDNFEWQRGYAPKYGLASVDRQTFRRTLKPSALTYERIVRANSV
jgi:beta-glucosidase